MSLVEMLQVLEPGSPGRQAWHALKYHPLQKIDDQKIPELQQRVVKALRSLPEEDYGSFCDAVNTYQELYQRTHPGRAELLPGFPNKQKAYVHADDRGSMKKYVFLENMLEYAQKAVTAISFISGAVGAGTITEYYTTNQPAVYLLSASGAMALAGIAYKLLSFAFAPARSSIDQKKSSLEKTIQSHVQAFFAINVRDYLRRNC